MTINATNEINREWLTEVVLFLKTNIEREDNLVIIGNQYPIDYVINNMGQFVDLNKLNNCYNEKLTVGETAHIIGYDYDINVKS